MAQTNSLSWPNIFDVSRNRVSVTEDSASIVSRVRLLLLTEPTELYNSPDFGVGLRKYLFQYNNDNVKAQMKDQIVAKLDKYEPCVDASKTQFVDGLLFTGHDNTSPEQQYNQLNMTMALQTIFGRVEVNLDE